MLRIDSGKSSLEWEKLPNGTYRAFATLGKADLPLPYVHLDENGQVAKRVETIQRADLFDDESISSAWGLPVTIGHPKGGLFCLNREQIQVGSLLQEIRKDDQTGELILPIVLHDRRAIELLESAIASGKRAELSPGYTVESVELLADGTYAQKGRRYDHLALIPPGHGRGQQSISIRIDSLTSGSAIAERYAPTTSILSEAKMGVDVTIRNDSGETVIRDVDPLVAAELKRLGSIADRVVKLEETLKSRSDTADRLAGENDGLKSKIASLESERLDSNQLSALIKARLDVWGKVLPVLQRSDASFVPDYELSPLDVQKLYLAKIAPHIDLSDKSDGYIQGIWDTVGVASFEAPKTENRTDSNWLENIERTLTAHNSKTNETAMERRAKAISNNYYAK